ncbi:MAG: hypothetical protein ACOYLO_18920, partial [Ferruginibacter sp.]
KQNTFIYKVEKSSVQRPDVTKALQLDSLLTSHGFAVILPLKAIKGDTYKVGFVVEDGTGRYYASANKNLIIPADGDSSIKAESGSEPATLARQVALNLNEPTREVNYFLDKVKQSDDYITVTGWGHLKGMDALSKHTFLLMKKDKNVVVFDASLQMRADVTKVFSKDKLNLDSSGFTSSIPLTNLEKGKYEIGFYITNGNQAGIVYAKRFVTVAK